MNVIPFKITGTEETLIRVKAGAVYFRSAVLSAGATDETIIVTAQGNAETLILEPGQGCPVDGQITEWRVRSLGGIGTIEGKLVFGNAGFTDNRLQVAGAVEVIDGGKARTIAGTAFLQYGTCSEVASQWAHVQIWNPAGSGRNVIVKAIDYSSSQNSAIGLVNYTAGLPTATGQASLSKRLDGSSVVSVWKENVAGGYRGQIVWGVQVAAGITYSKVFQEPIVIVPGRGLTFANLTAGCNLTINAELFEELVGA